MSKLRVSKRLARLVKSGICPAEDASKYENELKQLADEIADSKKADKQSRFFKALADETRLRIIELLGVREMCICEKKDDEPRGVTKTLQYRINIGRA